jgi:hypothetical protein
MAEEEKRLREEEERLFREEELREIASRLLLFHSDLFL